MNDAQLTYYDHAVLRLSQEDRTKYHGQVDRLISALRKAIHAETDFKVTRVIKAGSFAKYTILRRGEGRKVDVDVAFYLSDKDVDKEDLESLNDQLFKFLTSLYPNKSVEDFEIQKRAATVTFVGSGLDVDIVPIIQIPAKPDFGWQFGTDGSKILTNVPGQLDFINSRKKKDKYFRSLVRMVKQWKHYKEIPGLKGYTIELLVAFLLDRDGAKGSLEERFTQLLCYIAQSGLNETVSFPENAKPLGNFSDPVKILDPVNSQNNVAARITEAERTEIVNQTTESWETAHYASEEDDVEIWKDLFGPRFKIED
jgi:tRNA nucleotidyltransferase (CCA-adding enzyme)